MALGADDVETAELGDAGTEFDIGTATGHVGRDRHGPDLPGIFDDVGFTLVLLGVEHLVLDPAPLK